MARSMKHRGPDGSGVFAVPSIAFAHRRLSIIDIDGGGQPMEDERGFVITYNGEIYNYREIRADLQTLGEKFLTHSDTEVLLKAYIRWGKSCLSRLNGMFAFAIANLNDRTVFIVRDRIGIKPLYYAQMRGALVFASEIKALLCIPEIDREPDTEPLPFYLSYGYYPRHYTAFKNIRQLPPGHWLLLSGRKLQSGCYWDITDKIEPQKIRRASDADYKKMMALIDEAISMQTVADVPIGTFLSGGLDSGIVTTCLARTSGDIINTFTVGVSNCKDMDESLLARQISRQWLTRHHEIKVRVDDMIHFWDVLMDHFDQPFADTSALPTFLISQFARKHVKVILSGDGGDEQWGGYGNYKRQLQIEALRQILPWRGLRDNLSKTVSLGARTIGLAVPHLGDRLRFYNRLLNVNLAYLHARLDSHIDNTLVEELIGDRVKDEQSLFIEPDSFYKSDPRLGLNGAMLRDLQTFMVDDVLRKVDMMSMAVGLEIRVPLLDHRLVEFSTALSWRDKVSAKQTKLPLRQLYRQQLPDAVIKGEKKGFGVPINRWLRGPLSDYMLETLNPQKCKDFGFLNPITVNRIVKEHLVNRRNHGKLLVTMIALQRWLEHSR